MIVIVFVSLLETVYSISIPECLLEKKLYHEKTKTCVPPLEQGPCGDGQWVVLNSSSGAASCQRQFGCQDGGLPVLDHGGGAVCGCPEGQENFAGSCATLYTQSICGEGWVLLPESFYTGHKACPSMFSCQASSLCSVFKKTKQKISRKSKKRKYLEVKYLRELVCNKHTRAICCPDLNKESLLSSKNLIQSMIPPKAVCRKNPCPLGKWPWTGSDKISKCLLRDPSVEKCEVKLSEDGGRLVCPRIYKRSLAPIFGQKCGRRRRWTNGRCTRIFLCDH